jgi:hypothetical protein
MDQEYLNQLKIPTALSKKFPSRKKTDSAHHKTICGFFFFGYYSVTFCVLHHQPNGLRIFKPAKNSTCLKQEFPSKIAVH